MSNEYRYAWFEIGDRDRVKAFYDDVWCPDQYKKDPGWLDWQFVSNPNICDQPLPLLLAWHGDEIVGHMAYQPTMLWQNGTPHQVSWCNNLYVVPEHRRKKIAVKMYEFSLQYYPCILGSGQSEANHQLMLKYGWQHVRKVRQLEKIIPSFGYLKHSLREGPVKVAKRSMAMLMAGMKSGGTGSFLVKPTDGVSDEWDEFWIRHRQDYPNVGQRDAKTINWRLRDHPYYQFTIIEAIDASGNLRGFIGGRTSGDTGIIVDLFVEHGDREAAKVLVTGLEKIFRGQGVIRMTSRSVSDTLESALSRLGYVETGFDQHFYLKSDEQYDLHGAAWHVTAADSDLDR